MEKKKFTEIELEIILFQTEDVIATSGNAGLEGNYDLENGWDNLWNPGG